MIGTDKNRFICVSIRGYTAILFTFARLAVWLAVRLDDGDQQSRNGLS